MKKRLRTKLLLFAGINAIVAILAAYVPVSLPAGRDYDRAQVVWDYIHSTDSSSRISVILGDSRPECCLKAQELDFVNLSLSGSTPVEGYYQLRQLYENGATVDRLMLAWGPFHIFSQDTYHSRTRYFGMIEDDDLQEIEHEIERLDDEQYSTYHWDAMTSVASAFPLASDEMKFRIINIASIHFSMNWGLTRIQELFLQPERMLADPRYKIHESTSIDWITQFSTTPESQTPDAVSPVNELYLARLIDLAQRNGTKIHYLVMPLNEDARQPEPEYFERFDALVAEAGLEACYSGIRWWPNKYFWDPSHINNDGVTLLHDELVSGIEFCAPAADTYSAEDVTRRQIG